MNTFLYRTLVLFFFTLALTATPIAAVEADETMLREFGLLSPPEDPNELERFIGGSTDFDFLRSVLKRSLFAREEYAGLSFEVKERLCEHAARRFANLGEAGMMELIRFIEVQEPVSAVDEATNALGHSLRGYQLLVAVFENRGMSLRTNEPFVYNHRAVESALRALSTSWFLRYGEGAIDVSRAIISYLSDDSPDLRRFMLRALNSPRLYFRLVGESSRELLGNALSARLFSNAETDPGLRSETFGAWARYASPEQLSNVRESLESESEGSILAVVHALVDRDYEIIVSRENDPRSLWNQVIPFLAALRTQHPSTVVRGEARVTLAEIAQTGFGAARNGGDESQAALVRAAYLTRLAFDGIESYSIVIVQLVFNEPGLLFDASWTAENPRDAITILETLSRTFLRPAMGQDPEESSTEYLDRMEGVFLRVFNRTHQRTFSYMSDDVLLFHEMTAQILRAAMAEIRDANISVGDEHTRMILLKRFCALLGAEDVACSGMPAPVVYPPLENFPAPEPWEVLPAPMPAPIEPAPVEEMADLTAPPEATWDFPEEEILIPEPRPVNEMAFDPLDMEAPPAPIASLEPFYLASPEPVITPSFDYSSMPAPSAFFSEPIPTPWEPVLLEALPTMVATPEPTWE